MDMSFNNPGQFVPADAGAGMRLLTWHDLCSRITAMQDLRRIMATAGYPDEAPSTGSFHGRAARIIASGFSGVSPQSGNDESAVNPNSSVNGKAPSGTPEITDGRPAAGPR
jgi:hypothetical protein